MATITVHHRSARLCSACSVGHWVPLQHPVSGGVCVLCCPSPCGVYQPLAHPCPSHVPATNVSLYPCIPVSLYLYLSLCICITVSVSPYPRISVSASQYLYLYPRISVSVSQYLYHCICIHVSQYLCIPASAHVDLTHFKLRLLFCFRFRPMKLSLPVNLVPHCLLIPFSNENVGWVQCLRYQRSYQPVHLVVEDAVVRADRVPPA